MILLLRQNFHKKINVETAGQKQTSKIDIYLAVFRFVKISFLNVHFPNKSQKHFANKLWGFNLILNVLHMFLKHFAVQSYPDDLCVLICKKKTISTTYQFLNVEGEFSYFAHWTLCVRACVRVFSSSALIKPSPHFGAYQFHCELHSKRINNETHVKMC